MKHDYLSFLGFNMVKTPAIENLVFTDESWRACQIITIPSQTWSWWKSQLTCRRFEKVRHDSPDCALITLETIKTNLKIRGAVGFVLAVADTYFRTLWENPTLLLSQGWKNKVAEHASAACFMANMGERQQTVKTTSTYSFLESLNGNKCSFGHVLANVRSTFSLPQALRSLAAKWFTMFTRLTFCRLSENNFRISSWVWKWHMKAARVNKN